MKTIHVDYQIVLNSDNSPTAQPPEQSAINHWVHEAIKIVIESSSLPQIGDDITDKIQNDSLTKIQKTLQELGPNELEVCVRIVDDEESADLNYKWRQKQGATNVLSFPADVPFDISPKPLGDIVVCASVVYREAISQNREVTAHWAHMIVHGILHLFGYDHQEDYEATKMESMETFILKSLGFDNPYGKHNCPF